MLHILVTEENINEKYWVFCLQVTRAKLVILATGERKKKLPASRIENTAVVAVKYIQTGNTFNFRNQHKF